MALTTKSVKDGAGALFDANFVNDGAGHLSPAHVLLKSDAATAIDPASEAKQDALITIVGAVTASPTANTVLDRLKTIATNIAATTAALGSVVLAAGTAVIGKVGLQVSGSDVSTSNPVPVAQPDMLVVSGSVTSAATLFTQDCTGYNSISVQITSAGTSSFISFEASDNNTDWVFCAGQNVATPATAGLSTSTPSSAGNVLFVFPVYAKYFRVRVTTYGSGTISAVGTLKQRDLSFSNRITIDLPGTAGATASSVGAPTLALAKSANPTAVSDGQAVRPLATLAGSQVVQPYAIPAAKWRSGLITLTASDQALKTAGSGSVRNTATWGCLITDATWTANTVQIRDGTSVLFDLPLPAGAGYYPLPAGIELIGSAATALNIKASGAVTGGCYANIGGHAVAD